MQGWFFLFLGLIACILPMIITTTMKNRKYLLLLGVVGCYITISSALDIVESYKNTKVHVKQEEEVPDLAKNE